MRAGIAVSISVLLLIASAVAQAQQDQDVVMKAMQDELGRSISQLRLQPRPVMAGSPSMDMDKPYFIAYRLDDFRDTQVAATLGSLTQTNSSHRRMLGVEVRVGDYSLDNSNFLSFRTYGADMTHMFNVMAQVPVDDNYQIIRRQLWLATDAEYKKALEDLSAKRAALQNRKRPDEVADFSKEEPAKSFEQPLAAKVDLDNAEQLVRELSERFRTLPEIFTSSVTLEFHNTYTRYVNSEGTAFSRPQLLVRIEIKATTQAGDGQPLEDSREFFGNALGDLPKKQKLAADIREMGERLAQLQRASFVGRYNGPVLFEDEAAGEVFAQVFAPGLAAVRTPMSDNAQFEVAFDQFTTQMGGGSFLEKIGGRVLPEFVDLVDDPELQEFGGVALMGSYKIDDDGVIAHQTKVVEKGLLKTLLASRTPVGDIAHSTGNRRGYGPAPSNLVLTAEKTSSNDELRKELLRRARQRGRDYGIIVRRVGSGGLNPLARMQFVSPQGGTPPTTVLAVYKLFTDGHEELVRGAEVSGLNASAFRDIVGVGKKPVVYNDQFMPRGGSTFSTAFISFGDAFPVVSYVVPSLLFEEISLKKTTGPFPQPPASKSPLG